MRMCWLLALLALLATLAEGHLICEYLGQRRMSAVQLENVNCDIIVSYTGKVTTHGTEFKYHYKEANQTLLKFEKKKPDTPIYFGLDMCPNDKPIDRTFATLYDQSVEVAIRWAKNHDYAGVYIDLCNLDDDNQATAFGIMSKVLSIVTDLKLNYAFGIVGRPEGFNMSVFAPTASFIAVTSLELYFPHLYWSEYEETFDMHNISDFWDSKGANVSKLTFKMLPRIIQRSELHQAHMDFPIYACAAGSLPYVVDQMWKDIDEIAENIMSSGIMGIFLRWIDYDDLDGRICMNGSSPLTSGLRAKLIELRDE